MSQNYPFIGIFMNLGQTDPETGPRLAAFLNGVNAPNPVQGLAYAEQFGNADFGSANSNYEQLAQKLKDSTAIDGSHPDLYFTTCWPSLRALQSIGIVDPIVIAGLPAIAPIWGSLANVYGFISSGPNICAKWVELLHNINPNIKRVGVVYDKDDLTYRPDTQKIYEEVKKQVKIQIGPPPPPLPPDPVEINCGSGTLGNDITKFKNDSGTTPAGLIVAMSALTAKTRLEVFKAAKDNQLPAVYPNRLYVAPGGHTGLASRGTDLMDLYTKAGGYARLLIKNKFSGGPLPNPPINMDQTDDSTAKFETVINLTAADDIGLQVPQSVLDAANQVVR